MKSKLFILLIILGTKLLAQNKSADSLQAGGDQIIPSFEICYGYKMLSQNLQNNFNTTNNFKFNTPLQTVGLKLNYELAVSRGFNFYTNLYYNQIIPQPIIINGVNKGNITGFIVGSSWGKDLFPKKQYLDLILSAGFNTGRLRIYDNELLRQKNPFFAPKISLQPKICIKRFAISFTIEYDYDISKPTWRKTYFANSNKLNIDRLKQTGLTAFIGIGFALY